MKTKLIKRENKSGGILGFDSIELLEKITLGKMKCGFIANADGELEVIATEDLVSVFEHYKVVEE